MAAGPSTSLPPTAADLAALQGAASAAVGGLQSDTTAEQLTLAQRNAAAAWIEAEHPGDTVTFMTRDPFVLVQVPSTTPKLTSVRVAAPLSFQAKAAGTIFMNLVDGNYQSENPYQTLYPRNYQEVANGGMVTEEVFGEPRHVYDQATSATAITFTLASIIGQIQKAKANGSLYKYHNILNGATYSPESGGGVDPNWLGTFLTTGTLQAQGLQAIVTGVVGGVVAAVGTAASGTGVDVWNVWNEPHRFGSFDANSFRNMGAGPGDPVSGCLVQGLKMVLAADPTCMVMINQNHIEADSDASNWAGFVNFLSAMAGNGFPMSRLIVGFECHQNPGDQFTQLASRINALVSPSIGCHYALTETDVGDKLAEQAAHATPGPEVPSTYPTRDAAHVQTLMSLAQAVFSANAMPHHIGVWGLANAISWYNSPPNAGSPFLRTDGQRGRVTLLGENYEATSSYYALQALLGTKSPAGIPTGQVALQGATARQLMLATPFDQFGNIYTGPVTVNWQSGNTGIATIDSGLGVITPVGNGTAGIVCTMTATGVAGAKPVSSPSLGQPFSGAVIVTGVNSGAALPAEMPAGMAVLCNSGFITSGGGWAITGTMASGTVKLGGPVNPAWTRNGGDGSVGLASALTNPDGTTNTDIQTSGMRCMFPAGKMNDAAVNMFFNHASQGSGNYFISWVERWQAQASWQALVTILNAQDSKAFAPKGPAGGDLTIMSFLVWQAGQPVAGLNFQGVDGRNIPDNNQTGGSGTTPVTSAFFLPKPGTVVRQSVSIRSNGTLSASSVSIYINGVLCGTATSVTNATLWNATELYASRSQYDTGTVQATTTYKDVDQVVVAV